MVLNQVLAAIPPPQIIKPGETYIVSAEKEFGWDPGPIDQWYVLSRDEDILPALQLEIGVFLADCYELIAFVKSAQVLDDCYEFRFRCVDIAANEEIGYSLFLHRLQTFAERSKQAISDD